MITAGGVCATIAGQPAASAPQAPPRLGKRHGKSGTIQQGRTIARKWDKFREVETWADTVDSMLLHSAVYDAWQQRLAQMTAAKFKVIAADDSNPKALQYAEFLRRAFGLEGEPGMVKRPFEAIFKMLCKAHLYGFAVGEEIYYYAEGFYWLHDLESRAQRTISGWGPSTGVLGPIEQRTEGNGPRPMPMPGDTVIVATRDQDDTDWQGRGLARAALAPYDRLRATEDYRVAGIERGIYRPPKVTIATTALEGTADASVRNATSELIDAAGDYTAGKNASVFTALVNESGQTVLDLDWMNSDGFDPTRCITSEERDTQLIYQAFGMQWMLMGLDNNGGTRSLGEVQSKQSRLQAIADVEEIIGCINGPSRPGGGLVGRLIGYNFPDVEDSLLPTVWHDGLETDRLMELLPFLTPLGQAGFVTQRDALEDAILRGVDVEPLADHERRTPLERGGQGASGAGLMMAVREAKTRLSGARGAA